MKKIWIIFVLAVLNGAGQIGNLRVSKWLSAHIRISRFRFSFKRLAQTVAGICVASFCAVLILGAEVEAKINFEPVLVDLEFNFEQELYLHSQAFDHRGNRIDGGYLTTAELTDLIAEFSLETPELPEPTAIFKLELIGYELPETSKGFDDEVAKPVISTSETNAMHGYIRFDNIIFNHAGTFTFAAIQVGGAEQSTLVITVTVSEDFEEERLVATVNHNEAYTFYYLVESDLSAVVQNRAQTEWAQYLEQACETPDMTPIENAIERYGTRLAIHFENLETGCIFTHNPEENFFAASTTKAPLAFWLYTKADAGEIDLDTMLVYQRRHFFEGSGVIRHRHHFGAELSLREIIALNLYESDNVATQMLRLEFGYHGYADFIESLGGTREYARDIWNSRLTAPEAGFFMREIFNYIEGDHPHSQEFRDNLLNNQWPFIIADYPIASKTGWFTGFGGVMHDMAIVYAPSPYTLAILSAGRTATIEDQRVFRYISQAFQEFNRINFARPWAE